MFRMSHRPPAGGLFCPLARGRETTSSAARWLFTTLGVWVAAFALLVVCSGKAQADTLFLDTESAANNDPLVGQFLGPHDGTILLTGSVGGTDLLDTFSFMAAAGNQVTVASLTNFSLDNLLFFVPALDGEEDVLFPSGSTFSFTAPTNGLVGFIVFGDESLVNYQLRITGLTPSAAGPIPEPATILLLGTGLAGIAARVRKRKSRVLASSEAQGIP